MRPQPRLPSGTVTFLQTDIEGSSGWWEREPAEMRVALAVHDALIAEVVEHHDGVVVKHLGDGCWAAFESAPKAIAAAIDFQRRHQGRDRSGSLELVVRLGLHTGEIEPTDHDYFGPVVNRLARVVDLANGDQIVCSTSTAGLANGLDLRSAGLHHLRGIGNEEVFLVHDASVETSSAPLRRAVVPSNLPRPKTSFIGRAEDVASAVRFIEDNDNLVTLIGPGGVGKTRLAIEVGSRVSRSFGGNVHFCDLTGIAESDGTSLLETVSEIVGARRQPGMDLVDSIVDYLAGRRVLIILDNCEHVIDSARSLADRLIEADHVHVLATSREALAVDGEQQLIVSPLATDTAGVELFVDRAKQRDARFELTADNRAAVLEVAERLDGIPLAIELAAARIRVFTPFELAERLRENFKVLEAAGQTERQGTLNNTVRWSYELLSTPEAALFVRLSVFAGGFSLGAVEEICADDALVHVDAIPELMRALVDKSMIESQELSAHQRFRMLETLRVFAEGQLAQTGGYEAVRAKHADHFSQLALCQNERLFSPAEPDAWRVLDSEWSNLRTALDHYENGSDLDRASELVIALVWYATISMRFELFSWAEELLAAPGVETHRQFTDLCGAAALGSYFTVDGHVTDRAEIGLAADASDREGFCRCALAAVFLNNVHTPEASGALTSAWIDSQPQTTSGRLWAHSFRVFHLVQSGPSAEAVEQAAIVTRLAEESGSPTAKALAAWANGLVVSFDDLDRAVRTWSEGTDFSRSLPGDHLIDQLLVGLILHVTARRGELSRTLSWCQDALRSTLLQHYHAGTSHLFGVTAIALSRAGDAQTGARLIGSMIEHGHLPRRNARHELNAALGDDMNDLMASGSLLSVTQAAHVAIEALEAALERVNSDES